MRAVVLALLALVHTADARPRPHAIGGKKFEANKQFGAGLELGEPSALNAKYFFAADRAIDFGIGDIYNYRDYRGLTLYADHLWHPFVLTSAESFELPFYIGVGGQFWRFEDYRLRTPVYGDALGVRVPIGLAFDFNNVPLDIFVQVVPTLNVAFNGTLYDHSIYPWIDFSVGIRYWFT